MSHCYKIGFPPKSCSHLIEIHTNTSPYTMHNWNIYGRWLITHKLALNALECLKMICFTTMSHCYIFSFRAHVFQIYSQNPFYIPQWLWWWCAKVLRWYCDMMYSDVFRCIQSSESTMSSNSDPESESLLMLIVDFLRLSLIRTDL